MNKGKICLVVVLSLVSGVTFAAKENSVRFQNTVRMGYDDNVYQSEDKTGTAYITDIINISGKLTFSSRSDMLLYWQPEIRYRLDSDVEPDFITYQDLYARFSHAISQRMFLQISDRFRYQDKDAQSGSVNTSNQNYIENDLMGALDYTINSVSQVKVGTGYEFRTWDDSNYGSVLGNDYTQIHADGSYIREFVPNKTTGLLGMDYMDHTYEGNRGGFDSTTIYGGVDQNFTPNVVGNARVGYSFSNVENNSGVSSDTSSPYLQAGLDINPTARTSFTGTLGYSLYRSENSVYNAQDRFNLLLGVRHDLTGKINISSTIGYTVSLYDADYSVNGVTPAPDAQDDYLTFGLRGSYQINRNNFLDAGYKFSTRSTDVNSDFDRNEIDIGWRLRL